MSARHGLTITARASRVDHGEVEFELALGVILLFIAVDLREAKGTAACFATLTLGVLVALGVMGLWPLKMNFFNLVVMPAVVGLGLDAS
ncbi:hypothetical protein [Enhygromyxa salina]|uniref:hypothetical protein n=1 Tax=Enhygromyxa salina TaxID=215803 RepID=UPI0011B1F7BD|nr:hypothetical protein [Enhygromyxa salina]